MAVSAEKVRQLIMYPFVDRLSIILETDPTAIASRVSRPKADAGVNLSEITINEQTIMQVRLGPSFRTSLCSPSPRVQHD